MYAAPANGIRPGRLKRLALRRPSYDRDPLYKAGKASFALGVPRTGPEPPPTGAITWLSRRIARSQPEAHHWVMERVGGNGKLA